MKRLWLATQVFVVLAVGLWIAVGSGCGAKSSLRYDGEEESTTDPLVIPPVDCDTNSDCDDGEFCNGDELCVDGACADAEPVDCGDGDECHMEYCDEERDQCVEMLIAEDLDEDGIYASPCGVDCDDSNPNIYPGAPELCNGLDDDCDGDIDEDLMEPCADFGRRVCVDGEWSECLECTVCIPNAMRYCDTPTYCSWGEQTCNDRGDGWGDCLETSPPSGCEGYAYDQDCCLSSGECCQDWLDWDHDGDYNDSVGACEDVTCPSSR